MSKEREKEVNIYDTSFSVIDLNSATDPSAVVNKNKDWVYFGDDNLYPNYIIGLYKASSINKAIIDGITNRIYGNGLSSETGGPLNIAKAKLLFNPKLIKSICFDYKLCNNAALKIVTNKLGVPVKCIHYPFENIRSGVANDKGEIEEYWYSANWEFPRRKENIPIEIKAWKPEKKQVGEFLYVLKGYTPNNFYYGEPDYAGSNKWIETDIEIAIYHNTNVKTGFSAATIIQMFGKIPTPQQKLELERKFKEKYSGTRGQKIIFMFFTDKEDAAEITAAPLPDADKQYQFLATESRQQILIGHKVTSPMLLGIKTETGLGNNADEIREAENLFQKVTINPIQQEIEEHLQVIADSASLGVKLRFQPLNIIETERQQETKLSRIKLSSEKDDFVIFESDAPKINTYLDKNGDSEEELLSAGYKLFDEQEIAGNDELEVFEGISLKESVSVNFQKALGLTPNKLSKYDVKKPDGTGVWLVRYQYALAKENKGQPNIIDTSRPFCKEQIDRAVNGNRVYKREILENLVNAEFGSYDIFWYKGSYNCRHIWVRKLYFKDLEDNEVRNVGNVPYVVNQLNDRRATTKNKPPRKRS